MWNGLCPNSFFWSYTRTARQTMASLDAVQIGEREDPHEYFRSYEQSLALAIESVPLCYIGFLCKMVQASRIYFFSGRLANVTPRRSMTLGIAEWFPRSMPES